MKYIVKNRRSRILMSMDCIYEYKINGNESIIYIFFYLQTRAKSNYAIDKIVSNLPSMKRSGMIFTYFYI